MVVKRGETAQSDDMIRPGPSNPWPLLQQLLAYYLCLSPTVARLFEAFFPCDVFFKLVQYTSCKLKQ